MSARRRRTSPGLATYVGIIRFYEEVEGALRLNPYLILLLGVITSVIVIALQKLLPPL